MSLFTCPICAAPLVREGKTYLCPNRHSYDVAKEGYVHLLPANKKHSANPGDDKEMAAARTRFLDGGWYAPLREALCDLCLKYAPADPAILDAGCGEGYYTAGICAALRDGGKAPALAGVDLSKAALKKAARRTADGEFAVASVYHLPVAAESIHILVDCFAPLALEEYLRVLKPGGMFLYVVPGAKHLMEMKEVLYENPYENQEEDEEYPGLTCVETVPVETTFRLEGEAIMDLFRMTPYTWKTPKEGVERLAAMQSLQVTAQFRILCFQKEDAHDEGK